MGDSETPGPHDSFSCGLTPVPDAVQVLIVDDDPDLVRHVQEQLAGAERPSFIVTSAASLEGGIDALAETTDAIVLDLHLPDARGLETLRRMRQATPNLPIVVLTGVDDPDIASGIVRAGGDDFIEKDRLTAPLLARALVYALERRAREAELERLNADLERRVAERTRAVRATNAELAQANRDLAAFAHTASHDLRAPLRAIQSHMATILEDAAACLSADLRYCLDRAQRSADRMSRVLDGIDALSRVGRRRVKRRLHDAGETVWDLVEELQEQEPARQVRVDVHEPLTVDADPELLALVLRNLIGNAWKFTRHAADPRIAVGFRDTADGERELFVRDNGVGIDACRAAEIFQPFVRLDRQFEGDGIGLATVQRAVERHGGTVRAVAPMEGGTEIAFTLAPREPGETG